jgi:hypothetical protein
MTAAENITPKTPKNDVKLRAAMDFRKQSGVTTNPVTPKIAVERLVRKPVAPVLAASADTRSPIIME